jgi:hypothetical protein
MDFVVFFFEARKVFSEPNRKLCLNDRFQIEFGALSFIHILKRKIDIF